MRCRHSVEGRADDAWVGLTLGVRPWQFDGGVFQGFRGEDIPGFKKVDWPQLFWELQKDGLRGVRRVDWGEGVRMRKLGEGVT